MRIKKKANALRVPPLKKAIKVKRKSSDLEEESAVQKALENVTKALEKKNQAPKESSVKQNVISTKQVRTSKITKRRRVQTPRGVVYVGHIPHGFFEEQMEDYFKQFGKVTRVRVARSKNTGKSRGYGYVEFAHEEVARIAAETMNNYLMCGRLLKATYIPPEKQHQRFFSGKAWSEEHYPKLVNRNKITRLRNAQITEEGHESYVHKTLQNLATLKGKLKEKGFELEFKPTDLPNS